MAPTLNASKLFSVLGRQVRRIMGPDSLHGGCNRVPSLLVVVGHKGVGFKAAWSRNGRDKTW